MCLIFYFLGPIISILLFCGQSGFVTDPLKNVKKNKLFRQWAHSNQIKEQTIVMLMQEWIDRKLDIVTQEAEARMKIFTTGCIQVVLSLGEQNLLIIGGVALGLVVVQVL